MTLNAIRPIRPPQNALPTVCQLLHSLNIGGAEVLASRLAAELNGRFRFVFACLDDLGPLGEDLQSRGVVVELIGRKPGLDWAAARRLSKFLRSHNVQVVHAHQYTPYAYAAMSGVLFGRPPILFNEHGRFYPDRRNWKRVLFNRFALRHSDRVVAVGHAVQRALVDNEGIAPPKIAVIHNGIRLTSTSNCGDTRLAVRSELGIPSSSFVVIQVARLDPIKDHSTAIRALARLHASNPDVRLVIVGEGPARPLIEAEIARHNLQSKILMTGERRDVARLLAAADAFLLTSLSEGIPVTLIEAMAACVPVVSTDVGGVREVVVENGTGLLANVGDDEMLAHQLSQLKSVPELAKRLGNAGLSRAEELFSETKMHDSYAQLYHEMLGRIVND